MQDWSISCQLVTIALGAFIMGLIVSNIITWIIGKCENKSLECKQHYCTKLKEHDLKYCIAGLVMVIVFISTLAIGDNREINQSLSFASTISSIILSILAIIMTLLAEAKSDNIRFRMDQFLAKIEEYTRLNNKQLSRIEKLTRQYQRLEEKVNLVVEKEDQIIMRQKEMQSQFDTYKKKTVEVNIAEDKTNETMWKIASFLNAHKSNKTEGDTHEK